VKGLKDILARTKLRILSRKFQMIPISLPNDINKCRNVLICLPHDQRELTVIKQLLPDLSKIFSHAEIYLMAPPGSNIYAIFPRKGYRIMSPSADHITWAGLATKRYIRLLKENKYDLILDLNLEPNFLIQSILLAFPEAVRIGRGNSLGTPYYNLEIKTKFLRDEKNIYKSIIATIQGLRSPTPAEADGNSN